jgi:DNA-directed RNA polymerase II subunit RPB11
MNTPERSACFRLEDGEEKMTYTADTKVNNAGTFILNKEDHTIGNLLRMQLLRDPAVRFAGYQTPHPLLHHVVLKVQTVSSNVAPVDVVSAAVEDLANETDHLTIQMREAMDKWKKDNNATGFMGNF